MNSKDAPARRRCRPADLSGGNEPGIETREAGEWPRTAGLAPRHAVATRRGAPVTLRWALPESENPGRPAQALPGPGARGGMPSARPSALASRRGTRLQRSEGARRDGSGGSRYGTPTAVTRGLGTRFVAVDAVQSELESASGSAQCFGFSDEALDGIAHPLGGFIALACAPEHTFKEARDLFASDRLLPQRGIHAPCGLSDTLGRLADTRVASRLFLGGAAHLLRDLAHGRGGPGDHFAPTPALAFRCPNLFHTA